MTISSREQRLFAAARHYHEMVMPFADYPVDVPGSEAQAEQDAQIEAHKELGLALAAYENGGEQS